MRTFFLVAMGLIYVGVADAQTPDTWGLSNGTLDARQPDSIEVVDSLPDGLNQDNIDAVVRVRNRNGSGTGSVYGETESAYQIVTNYHVAGRSGNINTVDVWNNGRLVKSIRTRVLKHFFARGANKDISLLEIPKSSLSGRLPVIKMAEYRSKSLRVGDRIWQIGCDAGNWTNAERGVVLAIKDGVVFYLPKSISGNSGGPIYTADCSKQLGITTWVGPMTIDGKQYPAVGMAQTYDRFWDVVEGRVSMDMPLPISAKPIPLSPPIKDSDLLPPGATAIPLLADTQATFQQEATQCPDGSCWREPESSSDGRVGQGRRGLFGGFQQDRDKKYSETSPRNGPLGLGLLDGSILRVIVDFIVFLKWVLVMGVLLYVFAVGSQLLGQGWLRDAFLTIVAGFRAVLKGFRTAIAPTENTASPDLSAEDRQLFEDWKRSREGNES